MVVRTSGGVHPQQQVAEEHPLVTPRIVVTKALLQSILRLRTQVSQVAALVQAPQEEDGGGGQRQGVKAVQVGGQLQHGGVGARGDVFVFRVDLYRKNKLMYFNVFCVNTLSFLQTPKPRATGAEKHLTITI